MTRTHHFCGCGEGVDWSAVWVVSAAVSLSLSVPVSLHPPASLSICLSVCVVGMLSSGI